MANVMSRPEGFAMHHAALRTAPQALPDLEKHMSKNGRKVVAVEKHNVDWNDGSIEINEQFLWIKARDKITVETVREVYIANCGEPTSGLRLMHGKQEPDKSVQMSALDEYNDGYIVFTTQTGRSSMSSQPVPGPAKPSPVRSTSTTQKQAMDYHSMRPMNTPPYNGISDAHTNGSVATSNEDSLFVNGDVPPQSMGFEPPPNSGYANMGYDAPPNFTSRTPSMQEQQFAFHQQVPPPNGIPLRHTGSMQSSMPLPANDQPYMPATFQTAVPRVRSDRALSPRDGAHSGTNSSRASPSMAKQDPAIRAPRKSGGFNTMVPRPQQDDRTRSVSNGPMFDLMAAQPVKSEPLPSSQEYNPRHVENTFADEPDETFNERGVALQKLLGEAAPERLEAAVRKGVKILSDIERPLEAMQHHPDAKNWLAQIDSVREQAERTRTVVGVVGNTGAGKSSVINAMLDEERLVPTNCMRACTAVVTELSYNESKNPGARYRAEIEFIKPEDWQRELNILHTEVFDKYTGVFNKEATNPDSDAGVAWAKIKAVYFKKTKDQLAIATPDSLMQDHTVKSILGTTRRINSADCATFYKRLQNYVDSKDKVELDRNGNKKTNPKRHFEFWPLIKVVKVYTKADALSTGAVLVDLPGVHDSNAARAAVAEGYMKQCTGLWIVAPINRAIDDKAAKNLLGDSFKRQLKFDGTYSCVTFICSKTDDISRTEAAESLHLGSRMNDLEDRMSDILSQKRTLKRQVTQLQENRDDHEEAQCQIDDELEAWETLKSQIAKGKTVFPPDQDSKKRKRDTSETNLGLDPDKPVTSEELEAKLDELNRMKKDGRRENASLREQIKEAKTQIADLEEEEKSVDAQQDIMCIKGRNEYSRGAIQQDFAAGIRELDQEDAELEDQANFNPEEDLRDYDEVARLLPVFCVSSRAYQKLSGRLQKDNDVAGFTSADQTEVPQLQVHCKKLTENGRQAGCRRFLNALSQLLNSLSLWASDDGTGVQMSKDQRKGEKLFLHHQLKNLQIALAKGVDNTVDDVLETLDEHIFGEFNAAVRTASNKAVPTAEKWGAHRHAGGLFWATYKAVVRRYGIYTSSSSGNCDFNNDLVEPLYKHLATSWEKAFQRRLPHILRGFTKVASKTMKSFHAAMEKRVRDKGMGTARIGRLTNSVTAYEAVFSDLAGVMIGGLNEAQREVNREFTPVIAAAMSSAYEAATAESGQGSFGRMKAHMTSHVAQHQISMFEDACAKVKASLKSYCDQVRTNMLDRANQVYNNMQRDYMTLVGIDMAKGQVMPREERAMRRDVDGVLDGSDAVFQEVLDAEVADLDVGSGDAEEMDVDGGAELDDNAGDDFDDDDPFGEGVEDEEGNENGGAQAGNGENGEEHDGGDGLEEG